ncbi:hypothetical protein B0E50_17690 [Rhodanobacter sp. C01]|nr:hypothetical protein B0E50_17690 [Rhodanobacter sp. C01]
MGDVIYVDYADAAFLRHRYEHDPNVDVAKIVDIDAIWGEDTLQEAIGTNRKVDYVIACHVIEHVPDLITWLNEIEHVLTSNGEVRLAIPDKRYTFDYLRSETRLADVVTANLVRARIPQSREIIDFAVNKTQMDTDAAWRGEVDVTRLPRDYTFEDAVRLAQDAITHGTYHDVHCWVFTPYSFAKLMGELVEAGLVHFMCADFIDTAYGQLEFFCTLKTSLDKSKCIESWRAMCDTAQRPNPVTNDTFRLKQELLECNASLHKLDAQLRSCQNLVNDYRTSTSWKITAPLRAFIAVWRKLFAR